MGKSKLNRRQFLKLSAGAAAAAMFSPYMARLRAQDTQLRVSMWDSEVVKPTEDEVLQGFTGHALTHPFSLRFGAQRLVKLDGRLVPVQHAPFKPSTATVKSQPGQVPQ